MKFLILNGPNLNQLRYSEPGCAGEMDYEMLVEYVQSCCGRMGIETDFFQSNHEGDLIDEIQSVRGRADGIVRNCGVPVVEVLLETPSEKEPFRQTDIVSFGCQGHFIGEGPIGYLHACAYLAQLLRMDGTPHAHITM